MEESENDIRHESAFLVKAYGVWGVKILIVFYLLSDTFRKG